MLSQKINFYNYFEKPRSSVNLLSWRKYWLYNILVVVLMVIVYIISVFDFYVTKNKESKLSKSLITYQNEFKSLKNTFPQLFFSDDINEAVKNLKRGIAAQQKIISILSSHTTFSSVLIALSQSVTSEIWLTNIVIQDNGNKMLLTGNGIGIDNLRNYIHKLGQNAEFNKYAINLKNIKNDNKEDPSSTLHFEIEMVMK